LLWHYAIVWTLRRTNQKLLQKKVCPSHKSLVPMRCIHNVQINGVVVQHFAGSPRVTSCRLLSTIHLNSKHLWVVTLRVRYLYRYNQIIWLLIKHFTLIYIEILRKNVYCGWIQKSRKHLKKIKKRVKN